MIRCEMSDLPTVKEILYDSFYNDPHVNWIINRKENFHQHLDDMITVSLNVCIPMGHVYMNDDKTAAAVWVPQQHVGYSIMDQIKFVQMFYRVATFKHFIHVVSVILKIDANHPKAKHNYLFYLGVKKDHQGKGLGSGLLKETMSEMKKFAPVQYLETANPKNLPLYKKMGFNLLNQHQVEGGTTLYFMAT